MSQQQDLETVVNALLKGIKQQPMKTEVKHPTWIEKRFGVPKSPEEVIWRLCWLVVVPAITGILFVELGDWCWRNGFPMVTLLTFLGCSFIYWLTYYFVSNATESKSFQRLIEAQFVIPCLVMGFTIIWEGLMIYG